jgi:hypothetical protein
MTGYSAFHRSAAAALVALLLGLRLLGATGYMPAIEHGAVTIIVCPDADVDAPLAVDFVHHHDGRSKHKHGGTCPYASASSMGVLGPQFAGLIAVSFFATALLVGRTFLFLQRSRVRERPPLRGPPLPA